MNLKIIQFINKIKGKRHLRIDNSSNNKKEYIVLSLLLFIGCSLFTYTTLSLKEDTNLNASMDVTKASNKNAMMSLKDNSINTMTDSINLTSFENPFVLVDDYQNINDMSESAQEKLAKNMMQSNSLPITPNYNGVTSSGSGGQNTILPPIPYIESQKPVESKTSEIQGIMSDENGNKIAIVDGKIVKTGDSLNGNTISNINNNGITFNNGSQISYNIAK